MVPIQKEDFHPRLSPANQCDMPRNTRVLLVCVIAALLLALVIGHAITSTYVPGISQNQEEIPTQIGSVKVVATVTDDFYPSEWKNDPKIKPVAEPIEHNELLRTIPLIRGFVAEYPEGILEKNLKGIYLCKTLQFYGKDFGGTNSADGVYICVKSKELGYTNQFLLSSMHHEFSSILMRNYPFPNKAWEALNPKGFSYTEDAVGALGKDDLLKPQAKYHEKGFICLYSQSSAEEDFNTIADYLFNQRPALSQMAQKYSKLRAKIQLAMKFYKSVDARFSFGELESLNK